MKKTIMIMAAAMLLAVGLQAQDTIHTWFLKEGYLPYVWVNTNPTDYNPVNGLEYCPYNLADDELVLSAKYFYTEEEIPIYGIAAGLVTEDEELGDFFTYFIMDTSWDNAYEYFALYKRRLDTVVLDPISDSLVFHLRNTPISYYMDMDGGWFYNEWQYATLPVIPVYERYFDSAYYVSDSFYVGWTRRSAENSVFDSDGHRWQWDHWPVEIFGVYVLPYNPDSSDRLLVHLDYSDLPPNVDHVPDWSYLISNNLNGNPIYFLFPILTPEPPEDTTSHGGDSLAVEPVRPLDRLVSVQPNPATEQVRVLSSFGLTHLTAYDAAGVKVYDQAASGLKATLEVQGWPAGTYILHIQTPMGLSTKRLIVAR